ncbi:MAG: sodium-translocating pyrophosphatase [Promethearchaeota archaeon]
MKLEFEAAENLAAFREAAWDALTWASNPALVAAFFVVVPFTLVASYLVVARVWVRLKRSTPGSPKLQRIHEAIHEGARAYLLRQGRYLLAALVVLVVPVSLTGTSLHPVPLLGVAFTALTFVAGAVGSFSAGWLGMKAATTANVRVIAAVDSGGRGKGFKLGYEAGTVTGVCNVANFILGVWVLLLVTDFNVYVVVAYDFGASVTALFAQVGGGIFTKAADVGADLLGKLDLGIPEDDPRNAAVVADNVGDNVGDCAGRGADFFESASSEVVGGLILGLVAFTLTGNPSFVVFGMVYVTCGVYPALMVTRLLDRPNREPSRVVWVTFASAMLLNALVNAATALLVLGPDGAWLLLAGFAGLSSSIATVFLTIHFTDSGHGPTRQIMLDAETGAATAVLSGLSAGFKSTIATVLTFGVTMVVAGISGHCFGRAAYGDLVAATGGQLYDVFGREVARDYYDFVMVVWGLSTASSSASMMIPVILSFDTFGPIVDNAAGITEMAGPEATSPRLRDELDSLDATGNTTKAIAKGYAMLCAAFASIVLFMNYVFNARALGGAAVDPFSNLRLANPVFIFGVLLGAAVPFVFSAYCVSAVSRGANVVAEEARRQFYEVPGVAEGDKLPDYAQCVEVCTKTAIRGMLGPVAITISVPLLSGLLLGPLFVAALMVGALVGCALLGITFSVAGGAMDNAKKGIEAGFGGGKGTASHRAAVVGDTVGDPLKDTAGPSMNIVLTTVNTLALTFLPLFVLTGWLWGIVGAFAFF